MNAGRLLGGWNGMVAALALIVVGGGSVYSGVAGELLAAQDDGKTVWSGVFTEEQAKRGMASYQQECTPCHLDDLLGDGIAPALIGAPFHFRWSDLSVGDMFVAIRTTMPQGAPASLSPQAYIDIVSYLLQVNEFPAGDAELPTEVAALESIIIQEEAPQAAAGEHAADSGGNTVWARVFTEEQAKRGMASYQQECAPCHLDDLLGDGIAPSLIGVAFHFRWSDLSVGDMFVAIRTTMPQGAPASLSPQTYVDIVSYLLQVNEFPAGDAELPTEVAALESIIIQEEPPQE